MSRSLGQSVTLTSTGSSNNAGFYGVGWSQHRLVQPPEPWCWEVLGPQASQPGSRAPVLAPPPC